METYALWEKTPGLCEERPVLEFYPAQEKKSDATVVILPGGGYCMRAPHEGKGYAELLNRFGYHAFVCEYRVHPHTFPLPLLDARRALRYVRAHAADFGIDRNKIAVMGSSAGGHLAALLSTYRDPLLYEGDALDREDFMPNATILCYPVIWEPDRTAIAHEGSYNALLGDGGERLRALVNPARLVTPQTPTAFIWHTSDDAGVNVCNSLKYGEALRQNGIPFELHVFPNGRHGLGVAEGLPHVAQWTGLLQNWLRELFD